MASQPVLSRGVPIPPDEIHSLLRSAAIPGYTGSLILELCVLPEATSYIVINVVRRQTRRASETTLRETVPAVGEHTRKKCVQNAVDALRSKLVLRTILLAMEAHYVDGELKNWTVSE